MTIEELTAELAKATESISALTKSNEAMGLKNQELLKEKGAAKKSAQESSEAAQLASEEAAKKTGDMDALEKSWKGKMDAQASDFNTSLSAYQKTITGLTVGSTAQKLASDLALEGSAHVLLPHIQARLSVDMEDGQGKVRVLDKDGNLSAMTVADLSKEFRDDVNFSRVVVGSKASGAGTPGKAGVLGKGSVTRVQFDAMNPTERATSMKEGVAVVD